ncbi:MAG: MMPL family transporter [Methanocellales archaeon]
MANWILERYGNFVAKKPFLILIAMLFFLAVSIIASTQVKTTAPTYEEMMPKQIPEIDAMNFIRDEFGTAGESAMIVIEINPRYANSSEVRDIREPSVMKYCDLLEQKIARMRNVISIGSSSTLLKQMNGGNIPQSKIEIIELMNKYPDQFAQYINKDYSLALIKIQMAEMKSKERDEFAAELKEIVAETPQPPGVKTSLAGGLFIMLELREQIRPTMASTSTFSFIGILIIVFLLFMSIRHGIISLLGLAIGVILAYGLLAFLGIEISSTMSGGIAMIMGVGIDFGIQVVNRFRRELHHSTVEQAIATTLANTIKPMFITVLSALIGFTALSLGKMTVLRELGNMMSIGVLMCFLGAITVIPSILVINEKYFSMKNFSMKK